MPTENLLDRLIADTELDIEYQARAVRLLKPRVIEPSGLAELGSELFREGTIVSFVTGEKSEILDRTLAAIKEGHRETLNRLGHELREMQKAGLARPGRPAIFKAEHLVDVRYGELPLGRGLAPSFVGVAVTEAVWNGGALDHAKFMALDHVREKERPALQVVIVLVKPRLSDLEKAVLATVPDSISETLVKGPSLAWTQIAEIGIGENPIQNEGSPLRIDVNVQQQADRQVQQFQKQVQEANQQQQQQQNQDKNQGVQQQQQQQQDNNQTEQEQQQQQRQESSFLQNDQEGLALGIFNEEGYTQAVLGTDFSGLDATQSAKVLLRLREKFLAFGLQ